MIKVKDKSFDAILTCCYNNNEKSEEDFIELTIVNKNNINISKEHWSISDVSRNNKTIIRIQNRLGIVFEDEDFTQIISFVTEYSMKRL